jgi:hypothetical protein
MFVLGVWLVLPSRNWAGSPGREEQLDECPDRSTGVFRLYRGSGGATVGPWYSVTLRSPGVFSRERQIFYSYGKPAVESLRCLGDAVVLMTATDPIRLDYRRVVTELTSRPLLYFDGELSPPFMQPVRMATITIGWILLGWATFTGVRSYRRSLNRPLQRTNGAGDGA